MNIRPLPYSEATGRVKENYERIIQVFGTGHLPLFFQYIGPFPDYLDYITGQISSNLKDRKFTSFTGDIGNILHSLMSEYFPKPAITAVYKETHHLGSYLEHIYQVNMKLVFIFIALREAVKGWAVAAKKLSSTTPPIARQEEERFVYDYTASFDFSGRSELKINENYPGADLFFTYMDMCKAEFESLIKQTDYLVLRVETERIILRSLPLLPEIIFSPINVFLEKTTHSTNYGELLYLLCELFPQLSVQKALFSAYML